MWMERTNEYFIICSKDFCNIISYIEDYGMTAILYGVSYIKVQLQQQLFYENFKYLNSFVLLLFMALTILILFLFLLCFRHPLTNYRNFKALTFSSQKKHITFRSYYIVLFVSRDLPLKTPSILIYLS